MRRSSRQLRFAVPLLTVCLAGMTSRADAQGANAVHQPSIEAPALAIGAGRTDAFLGTGPLLSVLPAPDVPQSAAQPTQGRDSVLNGVLIGAGIGALLGLIPDYYDDCEECHDSLYVSIAVGAGIGLLVDALRNTKKAALYPQAAQGVQLRVTLGPKVVGFGGIVRWR